MYTRILVPVDGSEASMRGLDEAIRIAGTSRARLCLFHIDNEFLFEYTYSPVPYASELIRSVREQGRELLDQMAALARKQGLEHECVLMESTGGAVGTLIAEQARNWRADLIVMGTHGRRGIRRLTFGSDAEEVVRSATVPVLLVRAAPASTGAQTGPSPILQVRGAA